jgi:hypothetical protein
MKNLVLGLLIVVTVLRLMHRTKNKNAKYNIEVNGNCEICKKRIEKQLFR